MLSCWWRIIFVGGLSLVSLTICAAISNWAQFVLLVMYYFNFVYKKIIKGGIWLVKEIIKSKNARIDIYTVIYLYACGYRV